MLLTYLASEGGMKHDQASEEERVAKWLRTASARPMPAPAARARAKAVATERWKHRIQAGKPAFPRGLQIAGLAALLVLAAIGSLVWLPGTEGPPLALAFGEVEHLQGSVRMIRAGEPDVVLAGGAPVATGAVVTTEDGRLAISVPNGLSLRLDRYSQLRIDGAEQVTLIAGSAYVDTGRVNGSRRLRMTAPVGTIEHVGTQYQVTILGDATLIAVREGMLRLQRAGADLQDESYLIPQGRLLELSPERAPLWTELTSYDTRWSWTALAAPPLEIEGRSVRAFLDWICRENGWRWAPGEGIVAGELDRILLHGSIQGMAARDALALVAAIAEIRLTLHAESGSLTVSREPGSVGS
jgi:hypothetical protein